MARKCRKPAQDEYCENCGRVMVLKRGRFGQFMACTGYPDCKTTRRLDQGEAACPTFRWKSCARSADRNLVLRHGRYGEFISCSGYPDCKYIKQNFIGVKCPQCADGELVEKKARKRGNTFYGCSNYPKCEFTSAYKPVAETVSAMRQPVSAGEAFEIGIAYWSARTTIRNRLRKKISPSRGSAPRKAQLRKKQSRRRPPSSVTLCAPFPRRNG